jgi:RNA polymerase sigma factor (sigma-70 family)
VIKRFMIYFSDKAIIQGIKQKKEPVIQYLYKEYFPCILSMIEQNNGVYEDAEDIFHDGMVILFSRFSKGKEKLDCSLKTFFYAVCKNIWMQRLERTRKLVYREEIEVNEQTMLYNIRDEELKEDNLARLRFLQTHFLDLPKDCQKLLLLFFDKMPLKEIAREMGVSGVKYVKTRKYACKNLLRKKIMNDPACQCYIFQNGKRKDQ